MLLDTDAYPNHVLVEGIAQAAQGAEHRWRTAESHVTSQSDLSPVSCWQGDGETSIEGQALNRPAHRPNQVRFAKRLLNRHRARPDRRNRGNIAADE